MKNFLSAIYDSMLIFALLFIVVASFIATFALSPVPYKDSLLAKNQNPILGEEDRPQLRFEDRYEQHDFFQVNSIHDERSYNATIKIGPLTEGEVKKELVEVFNDADITRDTTVEMKVQESGLNNTQFALKTDDKVIVANSEGSLEILPKSSQSISFYMTTSERINFPIEVSINITVK